VGYGIWGGDPLRGDGLKYGGLNNTTANDVFGGFLYEIWRFRVESH
jgi:hypothetical protein